MHGRHSCIYFPIWNDQPSHRSLTACYGIASQNTSDRGPKTWKGKGKQQLQQNCHPNIAQLLGDDADDAPWPALLHHSLGNHTHQADIPTPVHEAYLSPGELLAEGHSCRFVLLPVPHAGATEDGDGGERLPAGVLPLCHVGLGAYLPGKDRRKLGRAVMTDPDADRNGVVVLAAGASKTRWSVCFCLANGGPSDEWWAF
mmetsp:Transcript_34566/g.97943  ORF Transcript_34566/g.97943 Transcript_34566/m.97943 type:complete len:200 (-) Transcript_34566:15-614(-)